MRFLTLPPFERAFEPSPPFERAFEPSIIQGSPITKRPFFFPGLVTHYNKITSKKKEEGFLRLFFFTKLTIQSQKKINFPMPLHRKHCKEGATVIT
jgi:hypothetical protein